jgi:acyl-CoA synthetase (AMP-forming)/AMP-acid ligase II
MLLDTLRHHALRDPSRVALIHGDTVCTYGLLLRQVQAACRFFASLALPPGSTVVIAIARLELAWVQGMALRHLGFTTVSAPVDLDCSALPTRQVSALVAMRTSVRQDLPEQAKARGWRFIEAPIPDASALEGPELISGVPEAGHILMTSGTTGFHKQVLRSAAMEASSISLHARINGLDAQSVLHVGQFPLHTAGGYRWPLMAWTLGATVVFEQDGNPPALNGLRISHGFATPQSVAQRLQQTVGLARDDEMRLLVTGGVLPRVLLEAAQQRLTRQVFAVLASTEALTLAVTPLSVADEVVWHAIHPERQVQVVDEAGVPRPAGHTGEVRVRILDGLAGYLDDAEASRRFFRDGWFYPGDLGVMDGAGRLKLQGRVTEVLNIFGTKIPLAPFEQALQDHLAVTGVCLFVVAGAGGDEVHLAIEQAGAVDEALLKRVVARVLGSRFGTIRYHVTPRLPRNAMGKVQRHRVAAALLPSGA